MIISEEGFLRLTHRARILCTREFWSSCTYPRALPINNLCGEIFKLTGGRFLFYS